jgi:hypothetical protein
MIKSQSYNIKNLVLTKEIFSSFLNIFWNDVYTSIDKGGNKYIMILCKVYFADGILGYKTIGKLSAVNYTDKELYLEYLVERLGILEDSYSVNPVSKLVFTYMVKDGEASENDRRLLQNLPVKVTNIHSFNKVNLPISMDPSDYGTIMGSVILDTITRYFVDAYYYDMVQYSNLLHR